MHCMNRVKNQVPGINKTCKWKHREVETYFWKLEDFGTAVLCDNVNHDKSIPVNSCESTFGPPSPQKKRHRDIPTWRTHFCMEALGGYEVSSTDQAKLGWFYEKNWLLSYIHSYDKSTPYVQKKEIYAKSEGHGLIFFELSEDQGTRKKRERER